MINRWVGVSCSNDPTNSKLSFWENQKKKKYDDDDDDDDDDNDDDDNDLLKIEENSKIIKQIENAQRNVLYVHG